MSESLPPMTGPVWRPRPGLIVTGLLLIVAVIALFVVGVLRFKAEVEAGILAMQRFDGPGEVVLALEAGPQVICHEYAGQGVPQTSSTQVRIDNLHTSISLQVTGPNDEVIETWLAGLPKDPAELEAIQENPRGTLATNRGLIIYRDQCQAGYSGSGVWLFDAPVSGDYTFSLAYLDGVSASLYDFDDNSESYEVALAKIQPLHVGFAVGKDPLGLMLFDVRGVKGLASIAAFGFCVGAAMIFLGLLWQKPPAPAEI